MNDMGVAGDPPGPKKQRPGASGHIVVIAPYRPNLTRLESALAAAGDEVTVNTTDSFHGCEGFVAAPPLRRRHHASVKHDDAPSKPQKPRTKL
ncbi:fc82c5d6-668b-49bb-8e1e-bca2f7c512bb [Thermothielavioides terrestris]|uniref:Fc82c5d6-668b-49bb-8e1e-bca2f7c512bb n=1 Tax=Thermothielavioides terrestris TaxID=2587410 RepID=A0A3S4AV43_9PEZI|nr:fc82c5d6-668b-49bb-8e1e-bca2f7c512bb [Thermothielavioides terrestris]